MTNKPTSRLVKIQYSLIALMTSFILFSITITYMYTYSISPLFSYAGLVYDPSTTKIIEATILYCGLIIPCLIYLYKESLYFFMIYLYCLFQLIPDLVLFALGDYSSVPIYASLVFLILAATLKKINIKVPKHKFNEQKSLLIISIISIFMLAPFILKYGINTNFNLFLLQDIYEQRDTFKVGSNVYMSYTLSWLSKAILPVLLLIGLKSRKYFPTSVAIFGIVYLFTVTGSKSFLFSLAVIFFFFMVQRSYIYQLTLVTLIISILFWIFYFLGSIFDIHLFSSYFIRRTFFVPALLKQYFFEFFDGQPLYLSYSVFNAIVPYELPESPQKTIGGIYFNQWDMNANNGFIADGFKNFGLAGVVVYSLATCILILYLNSLNIAPLYSSLFFLLMMSLQNSSLLTQFITHGLIVKIGLYYMLLKDSNQKK